MPRLDELIREVRAQPPDSIPTERIWAAIEARLVQGPLASPAEDVMKPSSWLGSVAPAKVIPGIVLALGSGFLGGWLLASPEPDPPRHSTPVPMVAGTNEPDEPEPPSQIAAIAAERRTPSPPPEPPDEQAAEPQIVARASPARIRRNSRRAPQADPATRALAPEAPDQASRRNDIRAELLLVEEMQVAFKKGDITTVLRKADQHAREFGAAGQLIQERLVHTVEALCAVGRVDEAKVALRELLTNWPESTHARRARSSCVSQK